MSRQHRTLRAAGVNPWTVFSKKESAPYYDMWELKAMARQTKKRRKLSFLSRMAENFSTKPKKEKRSPNPYSIAAKESRNRGFLPRMWAYVAAMLFGGRR